MTLVRHVIGIAGPMGAGKDTVALIISGLLQENVSIIVGGDILRSLALALELPEPESRATLQRTYSAVSQVLRKTWLQNEIERRWRESGTDVWVLNGLRMPWDIEFLRKFPCRTILFLSCCMEKRFIRIRSRRDASKKSDEADMTLQNFQRMHEAETETFIEQIACMPGVTILDNNGPLDDLRAQTKRVLYDKQLLA